MRQLTVTHHLEELAPDIGHAMLLRDGRVQAAGPVHDVLTGPHLTACFARPIEVTHHNTRWHAYSPRTQAAPPN